MSNCQGFATFGKSFAFNYFSAGYIIKLLTERVCVMDIIEISPSCICARVLGDVPSGRGELHSVAEEIFKKCGRNLWRNPEIEAYSNGIYSLIFVSEKMKRNTFVS